MTNDKPAIVARDAAIAAAQAAAGAATKSGVKTSEFWTTVLGAIGATLCVALIPTPFGGIAAAAIGVGAAAYANSRGNVKAALAQAGVSALHGLSQTGGTVGQVAGVVATIADK